jgi:hypothetical protein
VLQDLGIRTTLIIGSFVGSKCIFELKFGEVKMLLNSIGIDLKY